MIVPPNRLKVTYPILLLGMRKAAAVRNIDDTSGMREVVRARAGVVLARNARSLTLNPQLKSKFNPRLKP